MKRILVIDDEVGARESLKSIFKFDYEVLLANSGEKALQILAREELQLVLLDVIMPEMNGLDVLRKIQQRHPELPVLMVSASTSVQPVVEAIREGAVDYITKPFDVDAIRLAVARALQTGELKRRVQVLQQDLDREYPTNGIIGSSDPLRQALAEAAKAAQTNSSVLIHGESGTGKELVARYIHNNSDRKDHPFVAVHCAAFPDSLMESELFGYEKGAFTGATKRKPGRFDMAENGTMFFDEVSEMTLNTQVKLLRVLQEKEFMRVGGTKIIPTNARIIAACNADLINAIQEHTFREDLYYRLSVVPITLPSLRQRPEDIPPLVDYFTRYFATTMDVATRSFSSTALQTMQGYAWPGNIRELKNIVERMLVLHGEVRTIQQHHLPVEFQHDHEQGTLIQEQATPPSVSGNLEEAVNAFEKQLVEQALRDANGVQTRAAEILGTTRRILKYRMEKLNIEINQVVGQP